MHVRKKQFCVKPRMKHIEKYKVFYMFSDFNLNWATSAHFVWDGQKLMLDKKFPHSKEIKSYSFCFISKKMPETTIC